MHSINTLAHEYQVRTIRDDGNPWAVRAAKAGLLF